METLLGEKLPRPPPDVPKVADEQATGELTMRQIIEKHTQPASCAVCHQRIDPFGFSLERYDAIGRRRDKDSGGLPVDARARLKDGTEFDASYSQWHSDGTEINVSGLRAPITGDVCLGEWIKTGTRTYQLNHFGISYDPTGVNIVGPARIQQWLTIDPSGDSTSGKFTVDQWDEAGNLLAHFQGNVTGTRVTMDTGFQSVE